MTRKEFKEFRIILYIAGMMCVIVALALLFLGNEIGAYVLSLTSSMILLLASTCTFLNALWRRYENRH